MRLMRLMRFPSKFVNNVTNCRGRCTRGDGDNSLDQFNRGES